MNTTGEAQRVEVEIVLQGGLRHVSVVPSTSPVTFALAPANLSSVSSAAWSEV